MIKKKSNVSIKVQIISPSNLTQYLQTVQKYDHIVKLREITTLEVKGNGGKIEADTRNDKCLETHRS
jgi:hypothetical protein